MGLIGSLIGGVSNFVGGLMNSESQNDINKQQIALAREQMQYQTREREATQEYNSPVNQRKRFEAAGLNPYLMMQGMDAGNSTAQSSVGVPQLQSPQYGDAIKGLVSSINEGMDIDMKKQQMQQYQLGLEMTAIDAQFKGVQKILDIDEQIARIENSMKDSKQKEETIANLKAQRDEIQENVRFLKDTHDERVAQSVKTTKLMDLDYKAKELANEYQSFMLDFQKKYGAHQLYLISSQVKEVLSNIDVNEKKSANIVADTAIKKVQESGLKLDNYHKKRLNRLIRQGVQLDNDAKRWDNNHPSYIDRLLSNTDALDKRTGLQSGNKNGVPPLNGMSNSYVDDNGNVRW